MAAQETLMVLFFTNQRASDDTQHPPPLHPHPHSHLRLVRGAVAERFVTHWLVLGATGVPGLSPVWLGFSAVLIPLSAEDGLNV